MGSGELGPALLVIFEGPDAGGKGGALKRIVEPLDPRHYRVSTYAKPTPDEKRHHFLWRFYRDIPGLGGMALFDRSWYGRVLVERLEGFATPEQWMRGVDEFLSFERTLVLEGMILVKFWMHLSDEEQLRRFEGAFVGPAEAMEADRRGLAQRARNREYDAAAEEMYERTDHDSRPGTSSRPNRSASDASGCSRSSTPASSRAWRGGTTRCRRRRRWPSSPPWAAPGHRLASPPP